MWLYVIAKSIKQIMFIFNQPSNNRSRKGSPIKYNIAMPYFSQPLISMTCCCRTPTPLWHINDFTYSIIAVLEYHNYT